MPPALDRCSLIGSPRVPQPEQTGRLRRSRTVTITPSLPNATSLHRGSGEA